MTSEAQPKISLPSTRFEVTQDPDNKYIIMHPLDPETKKPMVPTHSLIYLHGLTSTSDKYYERFNADGAVPDGFRVVIP